MKAHKKQNVYENQAVTVLPNADILLPPRIRRPPENKKPRKRKSFQGFLCIWCREGDSNPQALSSTWSLAMRVCHFHHLGE